MRQPLREPSCVAALAWHPLFRRSRVQSPTSGQPTRIRPETSCVRPRDPLVNGKLLTGLWWSLSAATAETVSAASPCEPLASNGLRTAPLPWLALQRRVKLPRVASPLLSSLLTASPRLVYAKEWAPHSNRPTNPVSGEVSGDRRVGMRDLADTRNWSPGGFHGADARRSASRS